MHRAQASSCLCVFFAFASSSFPPPPPRQLIAENVHKTHFLCLLGRLRALESHLGGSDDVAGADIWDKIEPLVPHALTFDVMDDGQPNTLPKLQQIAQWFAATFECVATPRCPRSLEEHIEHGAPSMWQQLCDVWLLRRRRRVVVVVVVVAVLGLDSSSLFVCIVTTSRAFACARPTERCLLAFWSRFSAFWEFGRASSRASVCFRSSLGSASGGSRHWKAAPAPGTMPDGAWPRDWEREVTTERTNEGMRERERVRVCVILFFF